MELVRMTCNGCGKLLAMVRLEPGSVVEIKCDMPKCKTVTTVTGPTTGPSGTLIRIS